MLDIATEELSHLEVIGSIVAMLNKGVKAQLSGGSMMKQIIGNRRPHRNQREGIAALRRRTQPDGSSGVPWTAAYVDSRGDHAVDLRSNIASESRAKIVYERLINITDDPGIKEALGFLMVREVAHQKSFEKALYAIEDNFPAGKLTGLPQFANLYVNASQGDGDMDGPWNSGPLWDRDDGPTPALDGGDGLATVLLDREDVALGQAMAARTTSDPTIDSVTGADLGAGPNAGRTTTVAA